MDEAPTLIGDAILDRHEKRTLIFSAYTLALGLILTVAAKPLIWLLNCPETAELGIRTTGLFILLMAPLLFQHKNRT